MSQCVVVLVADGVPVGAYGPYRNKNTASIAHARLIALVNQSDAWIESTRVYTRELWRATR